MCWGCVTKAALNASGCLSASTSICTTGHWQVFVCSKCLKMEQNAPLPTVFLLLPFPPPFFCASIDTVTLQPMSQMKCVMLFWGFRCLTVCSGVLQSNPPVKVRVLDCYEWEKEIRCHGGNPPTMRTEDMPCDQMIKRELPAHCVNAQSNYGGPAPLREASSCRRSRGWGRTKRAEVQKMEMKESEGLSIQRE